MAFSGSQQTRFAPGGGGTRVAGDFSGKTARTSGGTGAFLGGWFANLYSWFSMR